MFISKFNHWLDAVDPYALQCIVLYKCLILATVEVYIYWIVQPSSFLAFFSPFFLVALYEAPVLVRFKEKEELLIFIGIASIVISISFYLVYPFRIVFFFFSSLALSVTYFYVLNHFYALKNLTMLLIATGAVVLSTEPPANLQTAYGFMSSTALSVTTAFICLRCSPNLYLTVWNRALQKFIQCLEADIHCAIEQKNNHHTGEEILHLGMVRSYRQLIPKKYLMQAYRMSVSVRNIQLALDNLYYETKNEVFWHGIKSNLNDLRVNMKTYTPCDKPKMPIDPETRLQHYVAHCLTTAFLRWNKLCYLRLL